MHGGPRGDEKRYSLLAAALLEVAGRDMVAVTSVARASLTPSRIAQSATVPVPALLTGAGGHTPTHRCVPGDPEAGPLAATANRKPAVSPESVQVSTSMMFGVAPAPVAGSWLMHTNAGRDLAAPEGTPPVVAAAGAAGWVSAAAAWPAATLAPSTGAPEPQTRTPRPPFRAVVSKKGYWVERAR